MNIKQLILTAVTLMAIAVFGYSLFSSWQEPQMQSQIELYQTDLVLQASQWQGLQETDPTVTDPNALDAHAVASSVILGQDPAKEALEQYQAAQKETQNNLKTLRFNLEEELKAESKPNKSKISALKKSIHQLEASQSQLALKIGVLQVAQGSPDVALEIWQPLLRSPTDDSIQATAGVLLGLWNQPSQILPNAEQQLQTGLNGWFQYRALTQLYNLQQRFDSLARLQNEVQTQAENALKKLVFVGIMPTLGMFAGIGLLSGIGVQRLRKGKLAWLAEPSENPWNTPWPGDIVWQVIIVTFFVLGQIAIPILFAIAGLKANENDPRSYGFVVLGNYVSFAIGGLLVLWLSVRPFLPLSADWFQFRLRGKALLWGIGGYLVAIPLVVIVSLANQYLWQGRGGSNPLLPIALNGQDQIALICFYITAAIAAPIFEEIMFRGFLLPSLTRYLPMNGAIVLSSFIFAIAHLSLSEVLPLMVLGMILGLVYTRSRNLLSPMLLHSLWNSGTLITLFILGSGTRPN